MLESINDWSSSLDAKNSSDVVYFDFAKAFDRVSHKKLLFKLSKLRVHSIICKWIEEFLSDRTFQVKIGSDFSECKQMRSGVPQGGVLSPLLFLIYTSDIPKMLERDGVVVKQFADDVKIYREVRSQRDHDILQLAVDRLQWWSSQWCLPLAPEKTVFMRIGCSNAPNEYKIGGHVIEGVQAVRDLGFHYNNKLDFSDHYKIIHRKAQTCIYQLFRGLTTRNKGALVQAYKTYVRPIVESSSTVFSPYKVKDIILLEKVQNSFTRKVVFRSDNFLHSRIPRSNIRNKYFNLNTLESRRKVRDVCTLFKMLARVIDIDLSQFYSIISSRTRGGSEKISYRSPRTALRRSVFTCRAASSYLKIRHNFALDSRLLNSFRRRVEKQFLRF